MCELHAKRWYKGDRGVDLERPKGQNKGTEPYEEPTEQDFHWFVGIFEGEGHYIANVLASGVGLSVGQKDPELLHRIRRLFGGSVRKANKAGVHYWALTGERGHKLAKSIQPFLTQRRQDQFKEALMKVEGDN